MPELPLRPMSPLPSVQARNRLAVVAAISICLIGSCSVASSHSTGSTADASVASVVGTSSASAPTRTKVAVVEGPLIRYDTSEAEFERLNAVYNNCLQDQGVQMVAAKKGISNDPATQKKYRKQITACASKKPETVPDREKRKDPSAYQDDLHEWVACMKAKGQNVILIPPDGWGLTDAAAGRGEFPDQHVVDQCQHTAFGS
jgi:hypothetical protein